MSSIKNAIKNARNYALKRTDIEILVRDATSNEKWGPSGTQMSQIAQATFSHADFTLVMNTLWERINDHGKNWRHIYKALLVVEYLLRCGSERVISECRSKMIEIKTLMEFQKIDDHDKDVGYSIRERAKHVIELMHDDKRLQEEREKASKNKDKYGVAVSNVAGGSGPSYSSTSNSSYSNNSTSSSYGGTTRKPMTSMGYTPGQGTYGSAMRENRDRDSYASGNSLEPRGSFRSSAQSNTRSTQSSTREQPSRTSTQPTTRARAPSISDDEYSISDDEPPRPVTSQPRRPSNSTPSPNTAQSIDDFFAPRGGSFVSAPSTAQNTMASNNADPLWAILAGPGPTAPSTHTAPTPLTGAPTTGYTPFAFPPAPSSSITTPTHNSAMLFPNTATPSVSSTAHSFQALSLNSVGTGNVANNGSFFPSPRNNEDDWNDFAKAGMSSSTPSTNSLSNQLGVKSDLIDLDSLTNNKRPEVKAGAAPAYRPIVASSTTPSTGATMTPNTSGMMMGNNNAGMMGYNTMGTSNMMMSSGTANSTPNMMLSPGMNYNTGMMMNNATMTPNSGMMGNVNGGMMAPNNGMMGAPNSGMMMNNNALMYNNTMMMPNTNTGGMMMMNNYPTMAVNNTAASNNSFKF